MRALPVRLALEPECAVRREALSALLWPEAAPARASQNLRQALYNLRRALGDEVLLVTPQTVQFNASTRVEVDVWTWRRLWAEVQGHRHRRRETCRQCLERLAQAAALYRGDLLAGFALKDSPHLMIGQPLSANGYTFKPCKPSPCWRRPPNDMVSWRRHRPIPANCWPLNPGRKPPIGS